MHNKKEAVVENKNSLTYPSRTLDPPFSIVDQAKEIEKADETIKMNVSGKLEVIIKQIKNLQNEAKVIIEKAHEDMKLHNVKCNFKKIPGEIIYLYKKNENDIYFSRLSPEDWSNNPPHEFIDAYKIELDRTFKRI